MSLIFRYLSKQVLASFALAAAALLFLFGLFDLIGELDSVRSDGYTSHHALLHVLFGMPGRLQELLPIAVLLGAIFAFSRLAARSEFTVMRASGLSTARLLGYLAALGILLGSAAVLMGEYVTPPSERLAQQVKIRSKTGIVAQEFRSGLWAKDGGAFVNIRQMKPDATLLDVRMYEFDAQFRLQRIRVSESATWSETGQWQLNKVTDTVLTEQGAKVTRHPVMAWRSAITPDLLSVLMVNPERMAISTLYSYVSYLKANQQKASRYEIALWGKLVAPFAAPIMLLLALPFAYHQPRAGRQGSMILLGIMIGLGFHLSNRLFGHIGLLNDWPPALSALLPLALFGIAALLTIRRIEAR